MYNSFYSSHDRIYNFEELDFPLDGVTLSDLSTKRPFVIFNMVSSVDGKATTYKGELGSLGSRPDRLLMKRLRSQVDAVLVGGQTLRRDLFIPTVPAELAAERQKNFTKPQPLGMVITNSGDLPREHRFWEAGKEWRMVITGEDTQLEPWLEDQAQIIRFPTVQGEIDLKAVLQVLFAKFDVKRLLVEGGAALNYALISQGFGDELFLSFAPYVVGGIENMSIIAGKGYGLGEGDLAKLKLRSLYHHDSELFLRYQFIRAIGI
ncbi:MAG: deaminase [Pseudanabaena sp.]|nr:MAG: deaminase [Pseudanabaena sp.]